MSSSEESKKEKVGSDYAFREFGFEEGKSGKSSGKEPVKTSLAPGDRISSWRQVCAKYFRLSDILNIASFIAMIAMLVAIVSYIINILNEVEDVRSEVQKLSENLDNITTGVVTQVDILL